MSNGSGLFGDQSALKPHLLQGSSGIAGEVGDLRRDVGETVAPLAAITVDEFTNPAAAGAADLKVATASSVAIQSITSFLAPGLAKLTAFPRNITFTTAGVTPADAPATAVITGTYRGLPQTETVTIAQTATIATGLKPFSTITSIVYAAGDDAAATVSIGVGTGLGVSKAPKARAGLTGLIREVAIGALVTTGTFTSTGLYTPASAPDGAKDYAVFYEMVPGA